MHYLKIFMACTLLSGLAACQQNNGRQVLVGEEDTLPVDSVIVNIRDKGPVKVTYAIYDSLGIAEGDMIILDLREASAPGLLGNVEIGKLWPHKTIPYTFHASFQTAQQQIAKEAMKHWEEKTGIRFVPRTNEPDYICFKKGSSPTIGSSKVGRAGSMQYINLGTKTGRSVAIHEIGHAVGLFHEQSRLDRDKYVKIIWDNIKPKNRFNFEMYGQASGTYDFNSRMHYDPYAFAINTGKPTIIPVDPKNEIRNDGWLSAGDIETVQLLYKDVNF